jgi:hypothetical protein
MDTPLDPYRDWLGIESKQRPLTLYQLLQLDPGESRTEHIEKAANGQIAAIRKFLSGPNARLARRTLYELESAKQCLLDPTTKRNYDDASRSGDAAKPIASATVVRTTGEARESSPPAIAKVSLNRAALDELSLSSVASLLDEVLPLAEEPPSVDPRLAALGIIPKPPVSARREAGKKIAVIVLAVAIPTSIAGVLLWLAIRWFDGPVVATAPQRTQPDANVANATAPAPFESVAPRDASHSASPQDPTAVSTPIDAPTVAVQPQSNFPGSASLPQRASPQLSASGNGDGAIVGATPQIRPSGLSPISPATTVATSPRHGSLLGPANPPVSGQTIETAPGNLSSWSVDLGKDVANLPIEDGNVPKTATTVLELLELKGFPIEPDLMTGPISEAGKPLRLVLRAADPRVEIRMQISGEPGNRTLSIRPVIVDSGTEGPTIPLTDDRINTMAAKLPAEFDAAKQKLDAVSADCDGLEREVDRLSKIPLNFPTEAANRDYAVRTALDQLRRLTVQRTNLEHSVERLQRRVAQLPALIALQRKIDRVATIRFRVFANVDGHQVELLGKVNALGR